MYLTSFSELHSKILHIHEFGEIANQLANG